MLMGDSGMDRDALTSTARGGSSWNKLRLAKLQGLA
jgi:hypothetical protein